MHSSCVAALDLLSATAASGSMDLTFLFFLDEDDEDASSVTEDRKVFKRATELLYVQGYSSLLVSHADVLRA